MAIVSTPTYPIVGDNVVFSITSATGNSALFEITATPDDSAFPTGVLTKLATGKSLQGATDDESGLDNFDPDEPGSYSVTAYEQTTIPGSPAYPGDPAGSTERRFVARKTVTVFVGALMDLELVTESGDGADLRIKVNDGTVRAASLQNFRSDNAESAAEQTAVIAALAGLVGAPVSTMGPDLEVRVNELFDSYESHRLQISAPASHTNADTTNTVASSRGSDIIGSIDLLNLIRTQYEKHCLNSSEAAIKWHRTTDIQLNDLENLPLSPSATTLAGATVLYCDLAHRCFSRHLDASSELAIDPEVHTDQDDANVVTAPTLLGVVIRDFFDALVDVSQTAQRGENPGDIVATTNYGFTRT